jgi:hypothetical protein
MGHQVGVMVFGLLIILTFAAWRSAQMLCRRSVRVVAAIVDKGDLPGAKALISKHCQSC